MSDHTFGLSPGEIPMPLGTCTATRGCTKGYLHRGDCDA